MRTRHSLLQTLDQRVLVLDGATGTGLMARRPDLDPAQGLEGLNVSDPDLVLSLHAEHLRAGCDLVRTNSFCASEPECAAVGRAGWARRLSRRAAELAREAAGDEAFVLGVLGPGRGHASDGERVEAERDRAAGLVEGGIDAVLVETARDLAQVHAALVAVRSCDPDLPTLVSFTVEADGRIASGATMEDVAAGARDLGVDVLALNCCAGPASLEDPLGRLRTAWEGPLGAWPNAGLPTRESSGWRWPVAPDELAAWMRLRSVEHDLRVIGGCCGSSVAHVAALRALWPRRPPI